MRAELPTGTVTLLFTDIAGSTRLLHELGAARYADALAEHRAKLRDAFARHGGVEVDTQGDAFFVAFRTAEEAAAAALRGHDALRGGPVRVRMGLHTGTPTVADEGYVGTDVNRAARVAALAHGAQTLVTDAARSLLPADIAVTELGAHRIKDFDDAVSLWQLGLGSFPPLRTPGSIDLPTPATRFVGRQRELYDGVVTWLDREPRVLTIVGPGGTGKTRFALELARLLAEDAEGGTVFVPLATLRDASLLLPAVAERLGAPAPTPEAVAGRLAGRRCHLVLDNVEQLLPDAAGAVSRLVAAAHGLRLIVTSRESLRIQGEAELPLEPLAEADAATLFLERARAVRPEIEHTAAVDELCARLDRLPLALELAAARVKLLTPEQVLERVGGALDLLRGTRDAEGRHATLRATIAWSYDLLDDAEREAFATMAVFRGSWTLEVAEAVCGVDLDTIASLLDKSLVRRRREDAGRFWMLETIREFAAERLGERPELELVVRRRHAERVREVARSAHLSSEDQGQARPDFPLVHAELAEIRAAIDWSLEADPVLAADIVTRLEQLWVTTLLREGRRVCEALLEVSEELPLLLRARVLRLHGGVVLLLGELELGERRYREAIELFATAGDAYNVRALQARFAVHAGAAADPGEARRLIEEVRRLNEDEPSPMVEAQMLSALADVARREGDMESATELYRASVETSASCGFRFWELWQLSALSDLQLELGRLGDASETAAQALELASELRDERIRRWTVPTLARALLPARPADAGLLWGALSALEEDEPWLTLDPDFTAAVAELAGCADDRFLSGVERGRTMPLEQAVAGAAVAHPAR